MYVWTIKIHNSAKKINWKCSTVSKWRPNNQVLFRVISILAKIWKTTFIKEFFNEIWLKVGEHEYIYITEVTFEKKLFRFKNGSQNKFENFLRQKKGIR